MKRPRKSLVIALWLLLVANAALLAQAPEMARPAEKAVESAVEKSGETAAEKQARELDDAAAAVRKANEDWQKYQEEERKYYEKYSNQSRDYFSWSSDAQLKKPFNQVVDDAIVSIRVKSGAKDFKNAGNQQIVEVLASQSQALPPPDRLNMHLEEHWYMPDTLEVTKPGSSASASIRMGSLKDYISEAISKLTYPPTDPSKVVIHPNKAAQQMHVVPAN
jgi:hypothetical protein